MVTQHILYHLPCYKWDLVIRNALQRWIEQDAIGSYLLAFDGIFVE